jgi:hypothetical protein
MRGIYRITMTRTGYGQELIELPADNLSPAAACGLAYEKAGDLEYSEKSSEYEIEGMMLLHPDGRSEHLTVPSLSDSGKGRREEGASQNNHAGSELVVDADGYVCFTDGQIEWMLHTEGWEAFIRSTADPVYSTESVTMPTEDDLCEARWQRRAAELSRFSDETALLPAMFVTGWFASATDALRHKTGAVAQSIETLMEEVLAKVEDETIRRYADPGSAFHLLMNGADPRHDYREFVEAVILKNLPEGVKNRLPASPKPDICVIIDGRDEELCWSAGIYEIGNVLGRGDVLTRFYDHTPEGAEGLAADYARMICDLQDRRLITAEMAEAIEEGRDVTGWEEQHQIYPRL